MAHVVGRILSMTRQQELGIKTLSITDAKRLIRKTDNLTQCYMGFAQNGSDREWQGAAGAAFLCAAYDLLTDWEPYKHNPDNEAIFSTFVTRIAPTELASMAIALFQKDREQKLTNDGLERGAVAFRFVIGMMGLESHYAKLIDLDRLGLLLQIADDILDYDDDVRNGDTNCLVSPRRNDYLHMMVFEMDDVLIHQLFPHGGILAMVLKQARARAKSMITH